MKPNAKKSGDTPPSSRPRCTAKVKRSFKSPNVLSTPKMDNSSDGAFYDDVKEIIKKWKKNMSHREGTK